VAAIAFGNVGNVPLVYVYSLCSDKNSMFWNTLGEACRETGVAYTSLDMMVATLLQFSLASWLLNPESLYNNSQRKKHASSFDLTGGGKGVEEGEGEGLLIVQDSKQQQQQQQRHEDIELIPVHHMLISKYSNGAAAATATGTRISPPNNNNNRSIDWYSLFPLPTQASVAGIIIGCIAPAKSFFTHTLHPVFQTLTVLGDAAVPLSVPLLGAVIYRGPGKSGLSYKTMVGVILVRLVLQPALMTGLVMGMLKSGLLPELDAMAVLTMLLANAVPTAINMTTFVVLYNHGVHEMSAILFWEYMCALMTLPAWMWLFLRIIGEGG
jgi:predicted permease